MLFDPRNKVIANIHAGWRGITAQVISKTVKRLTERFAGKREDIIACISPMIGPCCCEFSDPENELPKFMHPYILEENHMDLWGAVEGQLISCGVQKTNIENARTCTFCNPEDFHSHRRDKEKAGRFGTAIMLK